MEYALTKEHRRRVCVHESAHAVVMALAGGFTYRIQVAPEGATTFVAEGGDGEEVNDVWGLHSGSNVTLRTFYWRWCDKDEIWIGDRRVFEAHYRGAGQILLNHQRQDLRAQTCRVLAGPIADYIQDGDGGDDDCGPDIWDTYMKGHDHDVSLAWGFVQLLPWRNEFDSMAEQTEAALRTPRIWQCVQDLADEVERVGDLKDWEVFKRLLPVAVPGWPASPRGRVVTV